MHITWSKDGREIRTGGNFNITFVANTAHLRVLRVGKGDSGQYTCQASNEAGKDFCSAQLSVKGIKIKSPSLVCFLFLRQRDLFVAKSYLPPFPVWKYIESSFPEGRHIPCGDLLLAYCMTVENSCACKISKGKGRLVKLFVWRLALTLLFTLLLVLKLQSQWYSHIAITLWEKVIWLIKLPCNCRPALVTLSNFNWSSELLI